MKRFFLLTAVLAVTLASLTGFLVTAESNEPMVITEEHIMRIKENCVDAQSNLSQLHKNDSGLRVNRGQVYESMSTKLMAPFNSRIAFNQLDGMNLVSTAAAYKQQLDAFRKTYISYEQTLSSVLRMDCVDEPVAFYDQVAAARKLRLATNDRAKQLHSTIQKYGQELDLFAKNYKEEEQ